MYQPSQVFPAQMIVVKFSFRSEHITLKMFPSTILPLAGTIAAEAVRAFRGCDNPLFFYSLCTLDRKIVVSRYVRVQHENPTRNDRPREDENNIPGRRRLIDAIDRIRIGAIAKWHSRRSSWVYPDRSVLYPHPLRILSHRIEDGIATTGIREDGPNGELSRQPGCSPVPRRRFPRSHSCERRTDPGFHTLARSASSFKLKTILFGLRLLNGRDGRDTLSRYNEKPAL